VEGRSAIRLEAGRWAFSKTVIIIVLGPSLAAAGPKIARLREKLGV